MRRPKFTVTYSAGGCELTSVFQDPQEDGIPAKQKALDHYEAALCSEPEVGAWCRVLKDGKVWLDSRGADATA